MKLRSELSAVLRLSFGPLELDENELAELVELCVLESTLWELVELEDESVLVDDDDSVDVLDELLRVDVLLEDKLLVLEPEIELLLLSVEELELESVLVELELSVLVDDSVLVLELDRVLVELLDKVLVLLSVLVLELDSVLVDDELRVDVELEVPWLVVLELLSVLVEELLSVLVEDDDRVDVEDSVLVELELSVLVELLDKVDVLLLDSSALINSSAPIPQSLLVSPSKSVVNVPLKSVPPFNSVLLAPLTRCKSVEPAVTFVKLEVS